jgi:deazaflavin-dependent oxidoreductase (nitroreductase family)
MNQRRYSFFHGLVQKIGSSRFGAWFYARTLHHFDRVAFKLSGGRATLTSALAGLPVVLLTTSGAKTGLPRTLPLLCIRDERNPDRFALVASNWGQHHYPAWYHNLKANPRAIGSIRGQTGAYVAHEASGEEYERFWQCAANTYGGYPLYKQRVGGRRIPIMIMTPENSKTPNHGVPPTGASRS